MMVDFIWPFKKQIKIDMLECQLQMRQSILFAKHSDHDKK